MHGHEYSVSQIHLRGRRAKTRFGARQQVVERPALFAGFLACVEIEQLVEGKAPRGPCLQALDAGKTDRLLLKVLQPENIGTLDVAPAGPLPIETEQLRTGEERNCSPAGRGPMR